MARRVFTRHHVGRVRVRLAALLAEQGYDASPESLRPQQGAWRTDNRLDVCRWEATLTDREGRTWLVQCWDTMSDCVHYGVAVSPDVRTPDYLNVYAKRPAPKGAGGSDEQPTAR